MYRGCRRLVCSLVCVFSILFMLYLDTCTVNASSFNPFDETITNSRSNIGTFTFHVTPSSQNTYATSMSFTGTNAVPALATRGSNTGSMYFSMINGTTSSTASGNVNQSVDLITTSHNETITGTMTVNTSSFYEGYYHIKIPAWLAMPAIEANSLVPADYYGIRMRPYAVEVSGATIDNFYLTDSEGVKLGASVVNGSYSTNNTNYVYKRGIDILNTASPTGDGTLGGYGITGFIEFDISFAGTTNGVISFSFPLEINYLVRHVSSDYQSLVAPSVSDTGTQNAVKEGNEISQDTNTKITDFFGSFFDNLLHIFVPEDGYFSEWFDKVNDLLSEKLGMLYAPFDLVISTLQAIYSADSTDTGLPFPGIQWEDTWLVEPFTFTFASLGSDFDDLREKVYFATDTVLVFTFLMLLQSKVRLILEGHE